MNSELRITPLRPDDRAAWERLARGYKTFYKTEATPDQYETAWQRLLKRDEVYGLGATLDGRLVGIAHYLFHTGVWAPRYGYLQDLFVEPAQRGRGVARALIHAVAAAARETGAQRYYWLTQEHNHTARALYDKVAQFQGFIRYDYTL
ncbi:GNAT family N-acetyltransferase [Piscinibacter gummiphilus]|uniref:GNAT family N-acetyltransferase n=1 Tax=Piscinibacter gummiphilus TaxID=946333 RepID=A0ABZ0CUM5_9BURK|nr:GNAT family N-acetyltransferase [Piscinibacter gummiphilus]WOB08671.1 GNAT family N-acetyltransferase [Piscinibacter gummiphilus]